MGKRYQVEKTKMMDGHVIGWAVVDRQDGNKVMMKSSSREDADKRCKSLNDAHYRELEGKTNGQ